MKLVRGALVMFGMAAATLALSAGPANAAGTCGYGGCSGYGYGGYYGSYYGYPYGYGYGYGGYNVPVNICGNSVSVLGVSATQAACR
jgi:hypothetical protein